MGGVQLDSVSTAIATPNIALIKYCGKRNERLILPTNSSISMTLDEGLNSVTSVVFSKKLVSDQFYINGEKQDLNNKDIKERFAVMDMLRQIAHVDAHALVVSKNSFPTASGLASSASGICAMVKATSVALNIGQSPKDLSIIARQGSGSSCRSLFGGIVKWNRGKKEDGSDSFAEQVFNEQHWPDLVDIIAISSSSRKKVSSRSGMKQTVANGILYKSRLAYVEDAAKRLIEGIKNRDFEITGQIIMRDSNNMHATMLDTYPPIMYLNDVSKEVISAIHELNDTEGKIVAAYTFDAGPNAQIITTKKNKNKVMSSLKEINEIPNIITSAQGKGPRILGEDSSLINTKTLKPNK